VHAQRLTDSLFVPFYFSMSFQSSRFAPHYTLPTPSGKIFPHFPLIFHPKPKTRPASSTIPLFPFHSSLFTFPLHSFSTQAVELSQFPQHPRPSNPPHQKILTPSLSSTSSRRPRPSPPHFQPKNPDFPCPTFFAHCLPNWYSTSICEKSQPRPSRPAGKSEEPRTMRIGYVDYSRRNL